MIAVMGDDDKAAEAFVARWSAVTGSERANYQLFITELCGLLGVPLPGPASDEAADNADEAAAPAAAAPPAPVARRPWPNGLAEQIKAVAEVLSSSPRALSLADLEARFAARGRWRERLPTILDTLEALGRARSAQADERQWSAT
jgi:hypothetical protein